METTNKELIKKAASIINPTKIGKIGNHIAGNVGCALITDILLGEHKIVKLSNILPYNDWFNQEDSRKINDAKPKS